MRLIFGVILFWLSNLGFLFFIKKRTKLPYELILPILFSIIGILMFLAGILNIMKEMAIIICLMGLFSLGWFIWKKEIKVEKKLYINMIIMLVVLIYITFICSEMRLLHYDNFTHWGLIVKNMFLRDGLPNFENSVIGFRTYQPGSACFIYYFGFLVGKNEGAMVIGQNYLLVAYFFSLLLFTDSKKQGNIINYLLKVIVVVAYLFVMFGNIEFYNLLVDTLIAVMSVCCFVIFYYFRNDLKKAFIYTLPISIYLFLVKNTGIVLVGFNCLILLLLGIKNKKFKKSFLYALLTGVITVSFFYIWSKHVTYAYGVNSLYSKHSLSAYNIVAELRNKGMDGIFDFCVLYLEHFIDLFNNLPNQFMIVINLLLLLSIFIYKKNRKELVSTLVLCDVIYLMYYVILGGMYLLSMPWDEASYLAGFNRYMLTIVFVVIGIVLIKLFDVIKQYKSKRKSVSFCLVVIILCLGYNFVYGIDSYALLYGKQNYEQTTAYVFDEILNDDMYVASSNDFYYIYAPDTSKGDSGYLKNLSKYKLNTEKVLVVTDVSQIDENDTYYNEKVIVLDEDKKILKYLKNNDYKEESDIYIKQID